jgi:Uma2 family endonuclease
MPQPDVYLRVTEANGGQSRIEEDGYVAGAPQLVAEVAATGASYDLHSKLNVYHRSGVKEYIVWRVFDRAIDYFAFRDGRYDRLPPTTKGLFLSTVFPGLWLDPIALVAGAMPKVGAVLSSGLATRAHKAFVTLLKKKARASRR